MEVILRACSVCGALSDQGRCEQHRPVDNRESSYRRGYDGSWGRIKRRYRREHPICETEGCDEPSVDVHHIDGRGPRGDNSDANLMALCKRHHSRITVLEQGGFGRRRAS